MYRDGSTEEIALTPMRSRRQTKCILFRDPENKQDNEGSFGNRGDGIEYDLHVSEAIDWGRGS